MQQLAVSTPGAGVVLCHLDDSRWVTTGEQHGQALWPLPRPGRNDWTFSRVVSDSTSLRSGDEEIAGSRTEPPLFIAPRLPHYALWSPLGDHLSYVVPDGRSLSLKVATPESGEVRSLLSASPLFSAWVGTTDWLLCHHGATLTAFNVVTGEQRVISNSASGFRTPACAPDGSLAAWAEVRDGAVHVMASQLDTEPVALARFGGGVALAFAPRGRQLIACVADSPETGVFAELVALDLAGGPARPVVRGPLVAWWWDPAGERLASLHPTYSGDGRFQVRLHTAEGRFLRATDGFIPSGDTATMVSFFDQYALSHPVWSADGRWFGLAGRFQKDGPHPSYTGGNHDVAWVWDTYAGDPLQEAAHGQLLVFGR